MDTLVELSQQLAGAVARAGQSVVAVHGRPRMASSGIVWRPGVVVTAEHTLESGDEVAVTLPDGRRVSARVAGRDAGTDLAVLRLAEEAGQPGEWGRGGPPAVGSLALAVGRSPEIGVTAALGVVSGVAAEWRTWRGGFLDHFVRLDARLHPGASGGAVVEVNSGLLGLATAGLSRTAAVAVTRATVERVAEELLTKGRVARGYLGVGLQPVRLPGNLTGLIVLLVEPGGPADKAGVMIGDVLVSFDGRGLADHDDLLAALDGSAIGQTARAALLRGGERREVAVTVGERPR